MNYWTAGTAGLTLGDAVAGAAKRFGDREAYTFQDGRLSFREVERRSDIVARACLASGISRGDRVAILMASYCAWVELYFGLARIGAVMVPLNTRFKSSEIEYVLVKAGVSTLFLRSTDASGKDYGETLRELVPEISAMDPGGLRSARVPALRRVIDLAQVPMPGAAAYDDFLARGDVVASDALGAVAVAVRPTDDALIQFTSGTTSFPKGARLHHAGMLHGALLTCAALQLTPEDSMFSAQPFYHAGGTVASMLPMMISGARLVTPAYFDPGVALDMMESECTNTMFGHQPHFVEYLNHPTLPDRRLHLDRMMVLGPSELFYRVREKMGTDRLVSAYAMTETHLEGTISMLGDPLEKRFNSNGRATPGAQVEIRDEKDGETVLGPDQIGEIFIKARFPMSGYLDEPDLTRDVLDADGWYRTGDQGVMDGEGYVRLLGRVRDMIRVGGENLAGAEVEACLLGHSAVKQAVAVAAPDKRLGEVVVAFVELRHGAQVSERALIDHCSARLASFKVPRLIRFVTDWPSSGTGKIQKRLLLDRIGQGSEGGTRS